VIPIPAYGFRELGVYEPTKSIEVVSSRNGALFINLLCDIPIDVCKGNDEIENDKNNQSTMMGILTSFENF
jgi:hypothetical protein